MVQNTGIYMIKHWQKKAQRNEQLQFLRKRAALLRAVEGYALVEKETAPEKELYKDAIFSKSQLYLKLWQVEPTKENFDEAVGEFKKFAALHGEPELWNDYHLSCLFISIGKRTE